MCVTACNSVYLASAVARDGAGISGCTSSMPEAITPEGVALEGQCVVEVLIWGTFSIASESTVPLITLILCRC